MTALRGTSTCGSMVNATSVSTAVPTGAAVGDVAVLTVSIADSSATPTYPSGFTQVLKTTTGPQYVAVAVKVLTAADTGNYTITMASTAWISVACVMVSGSSGTVEDSTSVSSASGTTVPSMSLTTATAPFLVYVVGSYNDGDHTPPTGFTETQDHFYHETAYRIPGASGTHTVSGGTGHPELAAAVIALANAGGVNGSVTAVRATATAQAAAPTVTSSNTALVSAVAAVSSASAVAPAVVIPDVHVTAPAATATATALVPPNLAYRFAVGVSANGRYLTDQFGDPYMVRADAPWAILVNSSETSMQNYVDTRAAQGFNAVIVSLVGALDNGGPAFNGSTYDGINPFVGGDITALNSTYWDRVDAFVEMCADAGITVIAYPMDGWNTGYSPSGGVFEGKSETACQGYGAAVGARFVNHPNVIWNVGGDYNLAETGLPFNGQFLACMTGIRSAGADRLFSMQGWPEQNSRDDAEVLADGNMDWTFVYTYNACYVQMERAYELSPAWPAINMENAYEDEDPAIGAWAARLCREQAAWALTAGSPGYCYGHGQVWQGDPTADALDEPGALQVMAVLDIVQGLDGWETLVPDYAMASPLVTAGRGTKLTTSSYDGDTKYPGGNDYVTAAQTPDRSVTVLYIPAATTATVTVDTSQLTAGTTARWVDPSNGASTSTSVTTTYTKTGANADGSGDWFLIFEGPASIPANVSAVPATATATAPSPSLTVPGSVAAVRALATATAYAATLTASANVTGVRASATCAATAPSVTSSGSGSVGAVRAQATATAYAATLTAHVALTAVRATATASAAAPSVTASGAGSVAAVRAQATAAARVPWVSTGAVIDLTVTFGPSRGGTAVPDPGRLGSVTLGAGRAAFTVAASRQDREE